MCVCVCVERLFPFKLVGRGEAENDLLTSSTNGGQPSRNLQRGAQDVDSPMSLVPLTVPVCAHTGAFAHVVEAAQEGTISHQSPT